MGFLLGIGSALAASFQNTFFKGFRDENPFVVNWFRLLGGLPVIAMLVTIFSEWKIPDPQFWLILFGFALPVELLLSYLYVRAFQQSPQSLVGPLFSFSTFFLVPLGFFFLDETPSVLGVIGIISVMVGPFFLGKENQAETLGARLRNLMRQNGTWPMVSAAFVAACGVTITKFSFQYASPLLYTFYSITAVFLGTSAILLFTRKWKRLPLNASFFGMSMAYSVVVALHAIGLSLLLAAYFISLKRLSILFDVFLGRLVHHEDHFRERLTGAVFMVAGVILIALG